MSIESFSFKNNCIRYSPVKIVPEGGAHIEVSYIPDNWQRTTPVIDVAPIDDGADGTVTLTIKKDVIHEKTTIRNGEVTVPDGATVTCAMDKELQPIQIDVHRNGSKPMVFDPNTDTTHMHHLDGASPFTGQEFPNPLEPKMKAWEEKTPDVLNQKQAQEILHFGIDALVKKGFIHPRYEEYSTVKYVTPLDIVRAFLVHSIKKTQHLPFWSQISSSSISPMTEKIIAYIQQQPDWSDVVKRGKTFGIDLDNTMNELQKHTQKTIE